MLHQTKQLTRENMSKKNLTVAEVTKEQCKDLLGKYHYLSGISKGFKSGFNYGLFFGDDIVGVCIFTGFPVPELAKGCYGLDRSDQSGLIELSRLCLDPEKQSSEHNLASWFVSRAIKALKKITKVRAILSYADYDFHQGTVYRACNFKYYGLSAIKKDFWELKESGDFVKHSRGKTKGLKGEWRRRSQKHRFLITYDKKLKCQWNEIK